MHTLNYIIWNGSAELFTIGPITLRWYGLLFALGFLLSQQVLYYIYRKEGKPETDIDTLTIYMVLSTILGARLGHILFYQPEIIWQDPLGIILPFQFTPTFEFTGLQGLASHGAAIGILFALWLYSRKKKPGQNYLQVLDRIVIVVAMTGAMIRFGNYFNSEILGKPTDASYGIVFINHVTTALEGDQDNPANPVQEVVVERDPNTPNGPNGRMPIKLFVFFKPGVPESQAQTFIQLDARSILNSRYLSEFIDNFGVTQPVQTILDEKTNQVMAKITTYGISRHPAQLYEAISCIFLFLFLLYIWSLHKAGLPEGRIFGYFMIILWSLRFLYEYLKEVQVPFEENLPLDMGQILSIPLVIVGIFVLIRSYRLPQSNT
ncbi:MAG: prolipoprotein diacylglyceryl transferase [Cyclobacteriaceae bacterium]|nr:prolipoprotein diacylglyceryl transferase [Cyclobacteriaceae bacterium]